MVATISSGSPVSCPKVVSFETDFIPSTLRDFASVNTKSCLVQSHCGAPEAPEKALDVVCGKVAYGMYSQCLQFLLGLKPDPGDPADRQRCEKPRYILLVRQRSGHQVF